MARWIVQVERTYTARHVGSLEVEAASEDEAKAKIEAGWEDDGIELVEFNPTERHYTDTNQTEGYDDASAWTVSDHGHHEKPADAPAWAGLGGACSVCGGEHRFTRPCRVEESDAAGLAPGEFSRAKLAGYDVEPNGFAAGGWIARDPEGDEISADHATERAAWEACDSHRMFGILPG